MDKYFDVKIKNHKKAKKKIIFIEYLLEEFRPENIELVREMIDFYKKQIEPFEGVIVIFDIRNVGGFDKKIVWEGAAELKKHEDYFLKHIEKVYLITENNLINNLINIILKVMKNKLETELVRNIESALVSIK
mgnify:FL=1|tara:strand:- start:27 stop:425 length:399 start_codon:yes stop_codon:yes gene_type:complete